MKRGHRPVRTCLGCGTKDDRDRMLRLVANRSGGLNIQKQGSGRGGYLHKRGECWEACLGKKKFFRAFHMEIGREARIKLVRELRKRNWENADEQD